MVIVTYFRHEIEAIDIIANVAKMSRFFQFSVHFLLVILAQNRFFFNVNKNENLF